MTESFLNQMAALQQAPPDDALPKGVFNAKSYLANICRSDVAIFVCNSSIAVPKTSFTLPFRFCRNQGRFHFWQKRSRSLCTTKFHHFFVDENISLYSSNVMPHLNHGATMDRGHLKRFRRVRGVARLFGQSSNLSADLDDIVHRRKNFV